MMKKKMLIASIAVIAFTLFVVAAAVMLPQETADLFALYSASNYEVDLEGKQVEINFADLGPGVDSDDRLYVIKKIKALEILCSADNNYCEDKVNFINKTAEYAEDNMLDADEIALLKVYCKDVISDADVENYIDFGKRLVEKKIEDESTQLSDK